MHRQLKKAWYVHFKNYIWYAQYALRAVFLWLRVFCVVCQVSLICTESFVPLGLGGAFVTDEAQKWIALTPTAAYCCRNTYCLQRGSTACEVKREYLQLHSEKTVRRSKIMKEMNLKTFT